MASSSLGGTILELSPGRNFFFFVLGGGALFSFCGLINVLTNFSQSEGRADVFVGVALLVLGGLAINWGYRKTMRDQTSLTAYENGVMKVRNGEVTTILWDEVPFLFRTEVSMEQNKTRGFGRQLRTLTTWRLLDIHQTEISLESFEPMGLIAEEKIFPRLWREIEEKVASGETAVFGSVRVDNEAIYHGEESFSWEEIQDIEFDRHVIIHLPKERKRNWREAYVTHIPNMPLLQRFIDEQFEKSLLD